MGTNYYAIPKATDEKKDEIISAINEGDFQRAKRLIPDTIHIGKSSAGWQFVFNHNDWNYFDKTKASIEVFLLACEIHDEYDRKVTNEEFWNMVSIKEAGKGASEYDTIVDGLIFSTSTDFC